MEAKHENKINEIATSKGVYIVDVWAKWCKPCMAFMPVLESLCATLGVKLIKVDAEKEGAVAIDYLNAQSLPTIIVYRDGEEIARFHGTVSPEKIRIVVGGAYA